MSYSPQFWILEWKILVNFLSFRKVNSYQFFSNLNVKFSTVLSLRMKSFRQTWAISWKILVWNFDWIFDSFENKFFVGFEISNIKFSSVLIFKIKNSGRFWDFNLKILVSFEPSNRKFSSGFLAFEWNFFSVLSFRRKFLAKLELLNE